MATFTYDNRSTNSLSADSRNTAGSLTYDNKVATTEYLWSSFILPWTPIFYPWVDIAGSQLTLDIKN